MNNTSYKEQVIEDLKTWAEEGNAKGINDIDELCEVLSDPSMADSITGNASGSYYCNAYKAQEQINASGILWNEGFLDWLSWFDIDLGEQMKRGGEIIDVLAREWTLDSLSDEESAEACGIKL